MLEVINVSMKYRLGRDRIESLKESVVQLLRGQLAHDEFQVLRNISFTVTKGEVLGIVGVNGAGKSTLLKIVAGVLRPTQGEVKAKGNIVPMLELGSGFDFELTARENVFLNGALLGYSERFLYDQYPQIVDYAGLQEFMDVPMRNFSSGMVARLAFSVATMVQPEILIVDEVLAVGDAAFQKRSGEKMRELMTGGATVLLVSHSLETMRKLCSRVVWLEKGSIRAIGPTDEVCRAYAESLGIDNGDKA